MRRAGIAAVSITTLIVLAPAWAQRVDDNAVADAEDAFGSSIGGEDLGLYSPSDVRGFSPLAAGNVRLEGLYLDRQAEFTSRLVEGNRIRVGPSVLDYAFPAPSGIVDYRLRKPADETVVSTRLQGDSFGASNVEVDALLPLAGRTLGVAAGVGAYANDYASASTAKVLSTAVVGVWRPNAATEITPFWSRIAIDDEEALPLVVGTGSALPPRLKRRRFLGQPWMDFEVERLNYGVSGGTTINGVDVRAGLFRSADIVDEGYTILLDTAAPGEAAGRTAIADPGSRRASTSGELTLGKRFGGRVIHDFQVTLRGRSQSRRYGGADSIVLPDAPYGEPSYTDRSDFAFGARTDDRVRQWTAGATYQIRVPDIAQINLGLQRTDYRKRVTEPSGALPESHDRPWLPSAAAALELTARLAVYGGYAEGLEESDVAPEAAANRDVAPPAIRTRQIDAGFRWLAAERLTLIAGVFDIEKPYYGLDGDNLFRQLGDVRHRGIEASLTGEPLPGLTIVAGGVLLDAEVRGEQVDSGAIGAAPVGIPDRTFMASLDWRPPRQPAWSYDLSVEHRGSQAAHVANTVDIPERTIVHVGARYRFRIGSAPAVLRLYVENLFDSYGWEAAGSNLFTYTEPRRVSATLTVDF